MDRETHLDDTDCCTKRKKASYDLRGLGRHTTYSKVELTTSHDVIQEGVLLLHLKNLNSK